MGKYYQYYVEGKTDSIIIKGLILLDYIFSGKVDEFKVLEKMFKTTHTRVLKKETTVILVFDTDVDCVGRLEENIRFLEKQSNIKEVICIPQVKNLEDELVRSCNITKIEEFLNTASPSEFKKKLVSNTNIKRLLETREFSIDKMWSERDTGIFSTYESGKTKILRK